jgi:hypothetical protein
MGLVELPFGPIAGGFVIPPRPPNATKSILFFNAYEGEYPHGSKGWH